MNSNKIFNNNNKIIKTKYIQTIEIRINKIIKQT